MDYFLDDDEFEHIIDKDQVDQLELELQGSIGKRPQPVMECGQPELPSSSGASSVGPTDERMDSILDDNEFDQWMIEHIIDKDQVDQLELELQGLIGKRPQTVMECGQPELPSSSGASSVGPTNENMDYFLDDDEFEHIIDKDQVDQLELELQGLIGKRPQPVMECGQPELLSSSGPSSVGLTDERMDSILDDNEFDQWMIEHIIDKDQVDQLELELQGLIGKRPQTVMECGQPELPSSSGASSVGPTNENMDSILDDFGFDQWMIEHIIDKNRVDQLELELQGLIGNHPQRELPLSSGASSVGPTDEKMDSILDDNEFDQWMIEHIIDKDQVDQLELELQGLIGKQLECREPKLKKRRLECNNLPSSSRASSVEKEKQDQPSSFVEPHKLKGEKRRKRRTPSINLSSLMDNNVVSLGEKARYLNKKDNRVMAEGWVMREGIRCSCCKNVYCLSKFEVHAGSSSHRPTANIFLEDGRSLLQCQAQIKNGDEVKGFEQNPHLIIQKMESDMGVEGFTGYLHEHMERNQAHPLIQQMKVNKKDCRVTIAEEMKSKISCCRGNGICDICLCQGVGLLVCEGECLRMFHLSCIGLEGFPESVWFCPSCACGLCGRGEYNNDGDQFVERTIVYCDQCERRYHVGCLRERGVEGLESRPKGNWFCKEKCAEIFFHLQNFLGRSNPTGIKDLSWTIMRSNEKDGHDLHTSSYIEAMTKHKLVDAHAVLRDCYGRIVQPVTKTNLIKDIVFSKESKLPYQNYRGFYTMILDRGKKPISVATFRVHGDKVAEVPLLGTRVMLRRRGMASLLMNNLQKILSDMGVQKMILPIAPKFLQSWTTSYGFSKATNSDRFELLECPFIEFINNIMCQKILVKPAI